VDPDTAAALQAVPYLQAYRHAEDRPLISHYDPAAVDPGLNLYLSAHAAEAELVDMEGRTVHRWRYPLRRLWPELAKKPEIAKLDYWRHAHLFDDGRLLAIFEGLGLVALDADSNLLWAYRGGTHHDLFVDGDGNVHVLERISRLLPRMHRTRPVLEDFVTTLDPRGQVLQRASVLEAVERSPFSSLLERLPRRTGDVFHTNAVVPLDGRFAGRNPAFRRGNVLISMRELDAVAVLDPERNVVVWALTEAGAGSTHRRWSATATCCSSTTRAPAARSRASSRSTRRAGRRAGSTAANRPRCCRRRPSARRSGSPTATP